MTTESTIDDVELRLACFEDYAQIIELLPQVSSSCVAAHDEDTVRSFLALETFQPIVAVRGGDVLGYLELHCMPHMMRGYDCRIERVVVDKAARGLGIATKICHFAVSRAKVMGACRIDLTVENPTARYIYTERLGFKHHDTETLRLALQG